MTRHTTGRKRSAPPGIEETKEHIFTAGKELLLAAEGALHFCKDYVEKSAPEANQPALLSFFKKAISVADELGSSISGVSAIKRTAEGIAKPIFTAMEREMRAEKERCKKTRTKKRGSKRRSKARI